MGASVSNSLAAKQNTSISGGADPLAANVAIRPQQAPVVSGGGSPFGRSSSVNRIRTAEAATDGVYTGPQGERPLSSKKPYSGIRR